ncbi:acrosomal protein KIAA1210 homolog [Ailuropoda melanoleuca]|uniref:acrosomal protein KIAA1210 homolog n=1 Tax=Ailuropoda melanoleuca TaxID=9646 RepID=UPI001494E413|nr:acrosomal protein KIAA1210 homolog [Ailuropoda melanoleuca]
MAESLSEASGSLEVLEASDEGKKKSKFKAFKNFFGKKKKEPEDAQGGRRLKASLSSGNIDISSLKPVQEGRRMEARAKSSMGSKALSHDSIFLLDTEPEMSARRIYPSPEPQRGRPLQRSQVSRTLPRSGTSDVPGAVSGLMFGAVPQYVPRSGIWIGGSKIAELPSLHPRRSSNSPPLIRSDTISDDFEEISVDEESPRTPKKKTSPPKIMTLKKGKAKQEEPILLVVSGEEKSTTKPKEADQNKSEKDSAGVSSPTQSKRSELDKTTAEQAARADAAGSQSYPLPAGHGRRRTKKGSGASATSECGPRGRSFQQPRRGPGLGDRAGSPPAEKTARDRLPWPLPPEPRVAEQPPAPQAARAPRLKLLAHADGMAKRKAGAYLKARKGPVAPPAPEDAADATVRGPAPRGGDGACGAEPPEAGAAATTQDDVILSVTMEAQVFMDPSQIQSEGEEAFGFDLQALKFKMESVQDIPAVCRERAPGNILRAFTASTAAPASALADGGLSAERRTPRSLSWVLAKPAADDARSDRESASEESGSDWPLLPGRSVRGPLAPDAPQQAFTESETSAAELSGPEQPRLPSRYSPRAFGRPAAGEASSDPDSASEEERASERPPAPRRAFQPLGKSDDDYDNQKASASAAFRDWSGSSEWLTPRRATPALDEPEDLVCTESASYVEQYGSADDWSSAEEQAPAGAPGRASGKPTDPRQGTSRSENLPEEWAVSVERLAQAFLRPRLRQQASSGAARPPAPRSSPVEPAPAWPPIPLHWLSPQAAQHAAAGPPSGNASAAAVGQRPGAAAPQNHIQAPGEAEGGAARLQGCGARQRRQVLFGRAAAAAAAPEVAFPAAAGARRRASRPGRSRVPGCGGERFRAAAASPTALEGHSETSRRAARVPGRGRCGGRKELLRVATAAPQIPRSAPDATASPATGPCRSRKPGSVCGASASERPSHGLREPQR